MSACFSTGIPIPLSVTENSMTFFLLKRFGFENLILTSGRFILKVILPPAGVNLNAFDKRFFKICPKRTLSEIKLAFSVRLWSILNFIFFSFAISEKSISRSLQTDIIFVSSGINSTLPASILERSKMSLIRSSRSLPDLWMTQAYSVCFGVRFLSLFSSRSFARINTLFKGVLNSCDIFARNSDLYLLFNSNSFALRLNTCLACSLISFFCCSSLAFWFNS